MLRGMDPGAAQECVRLNLTCQGGSVIEWLLSVPHDVAIRSMICYLAEREARSRIKAATFLRHCVHCAADR